MSLSPGSVNFGNVNAGSSATQKVQVSNTGNSSVTVTQVAASGAGISVSGLAAPVTLAPSQSMSLNVQFAPTTSGATTGSVTVTNNDGVNAVAAVTGAGVQAGLSLTPASANFGSVVTGNTNSQTLQVKNSGTCEPGDFASDGNGYRIQPERPGAADDVDPGPERELQRAVRAASGGKCQRRDLNREQCS